MQLLSTLRSELVTICLVPQNSELSCSQVTTGTCGAIKQSTPSPRGEAGLNTWTHVWRNALGRRCREPVRPSRLFQSGVVNIPREQPLSCCSELELLSKRCSLVVTAAAGVNRKYVHTIPVRSKYVHVIPVCTSTKQPKQRKPFEPTPMRCPT